MTGAEPLLRTRGDLQPRDQQLQRIAVVPQRIGLAPIQRAPAGIGDRQPGFALADARELSLQLQPRLAIGRVGRELQARRAGVEDQDALGHGTPK